MKSQICKYAKKCGGCQLLNLSYEEQLRHKQVKVIRLLGKFCRVEEIIGMKNPYHYRNKAQYAFGTARGGQAVAGVYQSSSHRIVDIDSCMLTDPQADAIAATVKALIKSFKLKPYNEDTKQGFLRHILVKTAFKSGEVMVVLVTGTPVFPSKRSFVNALVGRHPEITTVIQNINNKSTSMVLGDRSEVLYGDGKITEELCGYKFRISPKAFYQINPKGTEILYNKALEFADFKGNENIIDAYCGTGTIGIIASSRVKSVIGVEINKDAVKDAKENARLNGIENIKFFAADAGKFMTDLAQNGEKIDAVIMDPARAGSDIPFLSSLVKLSPEKVVYVSCNPETLARDLMYLSKNGYKVRRIQPVDMFPHTDHIECVTLLTKTSVLKYDMNKIDINKLILKYKVRKMTESDIGLIYDLCLNNQQYYEYCSKEPSTEIIKDDLTVTPPGKSMSDKYYVGFFDNEKLIAVLDLIDGYPDEDIAFIGFFMLAKELQGQGIGSFMVAEICDYLKSIGFKKVRLGIDKDNPQSNHFWKKNGFIVLKEVVKDDGVLLLTERTL